MFCSGMKHLGSFPTSGMMCVASCLGPGRAVCLQKPKHHFLGSEYPWHQLGGVTAVIITLKDAIEFADL